MTQRMTDKETKMAIEAIIRACSSEAEVHARVEETLGITGMALTSHLPTDSIGKTARALVVGLGGLVMKNGAMVMFMAHGRDGIIS